MKSCITGNKFAHIESLKDVSVGHLHKNRNRNLVSLGVSTPGVAV